MQNSQETSFRNSRSVELISFNYLTYEAIPSERVRLSGVLKTYGYIGGYTKKTTVIK
jgi:hypothetical protein